MSVSPPVPSPPPRLTHSLSLPSLPFCLSFLHSISQFCFCLPVSLPLSSFCLPGCLPLSLLLLSLPSSSLKSLSWAPPSASVSSISPPSLGVLILSLSLSPILCPSLWLCLPFLLLPYLPSISNHTQWGSELILHTLT